jgi:hypothetical protein
MLLFEQKGGSPMDYVNQQCGVYLTCTRKKLDDVSNESLTTSTSGIF